MTAAVDAPEKNGFLFFLKKPNFNACYVYEKNAEAAGTNFLLTRTCTVVYGFSEDNCTDKMSPSTLEIIQPYTARIIMGKSLIEATFPAILSLFIGSWTDGNKKRKPFIILPLIGFTMVYAFWLIFMYFPIPPIYFLLAVLPYSLSGGLISLFTCAYCYLSDVTTESNRAFRMTVLNVSLTIGMLSGYLVSTEIYKTVHTNVNFVLFGTSLCCMILILMYTIFLLPEIVINTEEIEISEERRSKKSFFSISHIKESLAVLLKNRPSNGRALLILLTAIIVIDILVFQGESNFKFLSLKASFHWTAEDYNVFSAILSGVAVVTSLAGMWLLNRVLGLSGTFTTSLVLSMCCISSVLISLSKSSTGFYSSALFGCLAVLLSPLIKSEISYVVPNSEIGKVFAFTSTLEAIAPFAASPVYTEVYNAVISTKPLYLYFVSAGFWFLAFVLSLGIVFINCRHGHSKYQPLNDEPVDESNSTNS
ncbi:probable peptidoglycan muropeptide transporter SLC46 isoform X2 [Rhodnius prolixus]|uniref:probable peptidoglycan muropeptide transporter SLC46 isoform X2 n=1 Tax=Rhodnius prolixus TaxID=13249 RepID=UPI003D18A7C6